MQCRLCSHTIEKFFSLGDMPLVNSFLKENQLESEHQYDLSVGFCPNCYLVQLTETIDPDILFRDYIYFSSTSKTILEHNKKESDYFTERFNLSSESLVLEIASNDGAFLKFFKDKGINVLGIDPAENIAEYANKRGIRTIPEFFNDELTTKLLNGGQEKADIIYGANVLAHVPEILPFVRGVKNILKDDGTAIFESPYLGGLFENKFDIIYHEHVFYYSVLALRNLFKAADLEIYDVDFVPMQGGSFRIYASHPGSYPISENVTKVIGDEEKAGWDSIGVYNKMNETIMALKKELLQLLEDIKSEGKTIAAYSAPAKGIILLNFFGIAENYLSFIVDKAKEKQGLYAPGVHMQVYSPDKIFEEKPDYLLVLCWNIADEVIEQLNNYHQLGGKFIIPIPQVETR